MLKTWVQDVKRDKVIQTVKGLNTFHLAKKPYGSLYLIGNSRSNEPDEVGVYFEDPTG